MGAILSLTLCDSLGNRRKLGEFDVLMLNWTAHTGSSGGITRHSVIGLLRALAP